MPTTYLVNMNNRGSINSDIASLDSKQQPSGYESPLAKQLQQAWLQTQLPKRDVPKLDFLSPVASPEGPWRSSSSTSFHPSSSDSYSYTGQSEAASFSPGTDNDTGAESDPMDGDYVFLQYLKNMMMEEDLDDKKCMYQECSAYYALNKELADLIGSDVTDDNYCGADEGDSADNSWIDEFLSSGSLDYLSEGLGELTTRDPGSLPTNSQPLPKQPYGELAALACAPVNRENGEPAKDYANGRSGIESLNELYPLLMQCAQAVAADDVMGANALINELRMRSSMHGDGGQRLTCYFVEALVARLSGTGAQLYTAMSANRPSRAQMLKAYEMLLQHNPLLKICHMLSNKTILKAIEGAEKVHIIDYGILYGVQWPCFLHKLSLRPGGPPRLRITGIDFAQPGFRKSEDVEETGRRLAETAKQFGVDFEYHAIVGKWETIQPAQFNIRKDEVLIVNSVLRLRNLLDETVMASNPKKMVLQKIRSLNPRLFVMAIHSGGYNSPFFMARFREVLNCLSATFDAMHTTVPADSDLRLLVEREIFGRLILNVVACEGTERVERAETYKQWQSRTINAGFIQQPVDHEILNKAREILKSFHRNYAVGQDGNWMLSGWNNRVVHAITSWRST